MDFEEYLTLTVKGCLSNAQVRRALQMSGIHYVDKSWYEDNGFEHMSLWVNGVYRIYLPYGETQFKVQRWERWCDHDAQHQEVFGIIQ